jgi:uncharacterized caspase-like protein
MNRTAAPFRVVTLTALSALLLGLLLLPAPPPVKAQQDSQRLKRDEAHKQSERRLALVIGNSAYIHAPVLRTPVNDAADMAAALSELGYTVERGINLTQRQMKSMIREFGQKLKAGGQGVFYFAGHGVQLSGRNYLIPVDAEVKNEVDIEFQGVDSSLMLALMEEANNGLNLVILDACRNYPFARSFRTASDGLAQVDAPRGTYIAFAAEPGYVAREGTGRNSLYTAEILKQMRAPGLRIEDLFIRVSLNLVLVTNGEQSPWESSRLKGIFTLNKATGAAVSGSSSSEAPGAAGATTPRDTTPPVIEITSRLLIQDQALTVKTSKTIISGKAIDDAGINEVTVQGKPAQLDEQGNFSAEVLLKVGENKIKVVATDINSNYATRELVIRRESDATATADNGAPASGRYYALVIGNNDYQELARLKTAVNDAREVDSVLREQYGFESRLLLNAKRQQIIVALNDYRRKLGPNDNLLIYYAGHGYLDSAVDKAYWIPVDASKDDNSNWISADDVTTNVKGIPARHVLIVSDSCYSGTLVRDSTMNLSSRYIQKMIESKSRTLMASGGDEPVADGGGGGSHSVFANAMLRGLNRMDKDVFTAEDLFHDFIREPVAGKSNQVPEYSTLRNSGHESGDFVFTRKR